MAVHAATAGLTDGLRPLLPVGAQQLRPAPAASAARSAGSAGLDHVLLQVLVQQRHQQAVGGTAHGRGLHQHVGAVGLGSDCREVSSAATWPAMRRTRASSAFVGVGHATWAGCIYPMGVYSHRAAAMPLDAAADARRHSHRFDDGNPLAERNTRRAMWLTAAMMVVEIVGGWWFNSMAVLADGWHMSSHALALGLAGVRLCLCPALRARRPLRLRHLEDRDPGRLHQRHRSARRRAADGGAVGERLFAPSAIHYDEAIAIAVVGLAREPAVRMVAARQPWARSCASSSRATDMARSWRSRA